MHDDIKKITIESLGQNPERTIRVLTVFYYIAREYQRGARSLRAVSKRLEAQLLVGQYPAQLPPALSSLSRIANDAETFFRPHFALKEEKMAILFRQDCSTRSFSGLTPLGFRACHLVEHFFREYPTLDERVDNKTEPNNCSRTHSADRPMATI